MLALAHLRSIITVWNIWGLIIIVAKFLNAEEQFSLSQFCGPGWVHGMCHNKRSQIKTIETKGRGELPVEGV